MQIGLEQANIVILGPGQNPSLVTEGWVEDHGVLPGRCKQSVCTDALSVHESAGSLLLVDQEHFQLTSALSTDEALREVAAGARRYVEAFPDVVFQSLGLSYSWKIEGESGEKVPEIEVRLGAVDPRRLLGQERTLCGGFLIKTVDTSKLKVAKYTSSSRDEPARFPRRGREAVSDGGRGESQNCSWAHILRPLHPCAEAPRG